MTQNRTHVIIIKHLHTNMIGTRRKICVSLIHHNTIHLQSQTALRDRFPTRTSCVYIIPYARHTHDDDVMSTVTVTYAVLRNRADLICHRENRFPQCRKHRFRRDVWFSFMWPCDNKKKTTRNPLKIETSFGLNQRVSPLSSAGLVRPLWRQSY